MQRLSFCVYDNIPRIKKREIFIQTSISHFMKCQKWILILFYENTNFEPSGKFYFFEKGMKKGSSKEVSAQKWKRWRRWWRKFIIFHLPALSDVQTTIQFFN